MDNPAAPAESLNVEQLLHLHTLTKDVAKVCQKQLRGYLDTLALLFRPRRILGDAMEGAERESVGGSDRLAPLPPAPSPSGPPPPGPTPWRAPSGTPSVPPPPPSPSPASSSVRSP